jgi:hypothetical protein
MLISSLTEKALILEPVDESCERRVRALGAAEGGEVEGKWMQGWVYGVSVLIGVVRH